MRTLLSALVLICSFCIVAQAAVLEIALKDQNGAPVMDAVVSIIPMSGETPTMPETPSAIEIEQRDGAFHPAVTVVRTGTRISFPNRDGIQHHVYSLSPAKRFDLPLHGNEERPAETFDKPGVVAIGCNIHDWMRAHIVVVETPWFAKTDESGTTRIDAPVGRYRAELWHHRLSKPLATEVVVSAGASTLLQQTLTLRRERKPFRAAEAAGEAYR